VTGVTSAASNGLAVAADGRSLLVSNVASADQIEMNDYSVRYEHAGEPGHDAIHVYSAADGSLAGTVGSLGCFPGELQFSSPQQVWVAAVGSVFVAESDNRRVQVLTPGLTFHCFVGADHLAVVSGVCANADVVSPSSSQRDRTGILSWL
jgi:hypothetical protein